MSELNRGARGGSAYRTGGLFVAMGAGALLPGAYLLSPSIPPLIALMLFFSSIDLPITAESFRGTVWGVLAANIAIAFLGYLLLAPFDRDLALVAFLTGVTPTAVSAPVIISFLEGRTGYVVAAVMITNVFVALALPFILPLVAGDAAAVATRDLLAPVLLVLLLPLGLSRAVAYLPDAIRRHIGRGKSLSFTLWLVVLFLVTAKSVHGIECGLGLPPLRLAAIALTSLIVCVVNFSIGALLGGPEFRREASQSLGQKNNALTIWIGLTFLSPQAALGPTCYVIYHNVYNSLQIFAHERSRVRGPA